MLVRTKLLRRTNLKKKEGVVKDNINVEDENIASNHSMKTFDNVGTALSGGQRNAKQEKVWYKHETVPQYVQNKQPSSSIKATGNSLTVKKNTLNAKHGGFNIGQQNDLRLQGMTNFSPTQEIAQNSNSCAFELSGVQKHKMDIFAAEYVGKICEIALSRNVKEKSLELAKDFVTNVVNLAERRIMECENPQSRKEDVGFEEKDNLEKNDGCEESPSFSKVWKYSQVFATEHEIPESLRRENSRLRDSEFETCSKLRRKGDVQVRNGCEYEELGPKEVAESPMSSNSSLTTNASNSSTQSLELQKPHTKNDSLPTYELDNELNTHCVPKKAANNPHSLPGIISEFEHSNDEILANDQLDTNTKFDTSAYSPEDGEVTSDNCYTCAKEVAFEGSDESKKTKSEKSNDMGNAVSVNDLASTVNLDKTRQEKGSENENTNCSQNDEIGFCNELNSAAEENETTKTEGKHGPPNIFTGDLSSNAGKKETNGILPAKKQENDSRNESNYRRRALYKRTVSESQASERKQWCSTEPGGEDFQATFRRFHSSCRPDSTAPKFVRSTSCPVVSEVSRNLCSSLINAWNH